MYEGKQKVLEGVALPILQKIGSRSDSTAAGGMPDFFGGSAQATPGHAAEAKTGDDGPTIEEID